MGSRSLCLFIVGTLALCACAQRSAAVISTFTTRAAFNGAATGPLTIEGFEATPIGDLTLPATIAPTNLVVSRPLGTVSVYVSNTADFGFVNTTPGGSKYLAYGRNLIGGGSETGAYDALFTLPVPANAFAFDYSGFQPALFGSNGFTITLFNGATQVDSAFVPDATDFGVDFRGFVSTNVFDRARISITTTITAADYTAFDEITWNTIPEPTALAVLLGLPMFALRRRRIDGGR